MVSGLPNYGPSSCASRRNHRGISYKRIFIFLIACCILGYAAVYWYLSSFVEEETYVLYLASPDAVAQELGLKRTVVDTACSQTSSRCYSVVDRVIENHDEPSFVERCLFVDGFKDESESSVRLIIPDGWSFATSDSRLWEIDHQKLTAEYVACMIIAPFVFDVFDITNKHESKSVLEIGLGGGLYDSFLRLHRPQMHMTSVELDGTVVSLAEKWFGHKINEHFQTVIGDGVEFVFEALKRKHSYDVVILDACSTDQHLPCPADVFLDDKFQEALPQILKPKGIVIVNILELSGDTAVIDSVAKIFSAHFKSCMAMHVDTEVNVVLVCLEYSINNPEAQIRFFETRIEPVLKELRLQDTVTGVVISAPYSSH